MNLQMWLDMMRRFCIAENRLTYHQLETCYNEKHRHYHTHKHIQAMLFYFQEITDLFQNPLDVELAIWFHDAIYKVFSSNNEQASADWAKAFLFENKVKKSISLRVYDLIMVTSHLSIPKSIDQELMLDIDLSILAAKEDIYDQYETNIRKEYHLIPNFIYRKKRKQLLSGFLNRKRIYYSDYFHTRWDKQARNNLERAIQRL